MNLWLGIDFGTCYSSAAYVDRTGNINFVRDTDNPGNYAYSIPSSAYVQPDGKILVGNAAIEQMKIDPTRYFSEIKRDLGKNIPYYYDGGQTMPEELVTHILSKLKKAAEAQAGQSFPHLIVTVPATYDAYKREIMKTAAQKSGFDRVEIIEEPVAAALSYFQGPDDIANGDILLVYDLGGGTFDAALMKKTGAGYRLLTQPVGDPECGGLDFDRRLFLKLLEQCEPDFRNRLDAEIIDELDLKKSRRIFIKRKAMQDYCCKFKHGLSSQDQLSLVAPDAVLDDVEFFSYSRTEFENLIGEMLQGTLEKCDLLIKNAKISIDKLDRIVMTGGSSRIPKVRELLSKHYGKTIQLSADPELSICSGAALYGENRRKMMESPIVSASGRPGTYSSIADAIEEAEIGAVIHVEAGQYEESLIMKKGCSIVGAGTGKTIWKAIPGRCCVEIENCETSIQNFSLIGSDETHVDCLRFHGGRISISECELEPGHEEETVGINCLGGGFVTIQQSTIKGGCAGLMINDLSTADVSLNNVSIVGCKKNGVIMTGQATCRMQGGSVTDIKADDPKSAAIGIAAQKGKLLLSGVFFLNNIFGIEISHDAEGDFAECRFEANSVALLASVRKNAVHAKKCTILNNKQGIWVDEDATVRATECSFSGNNTAFSLHGNGTADIDSSNFFNNVKGIDVSENASLKLTDSHFDAGGTGVFALSKKVAIKGCSFRKAEACCIHFAGDSICSVSMSKLVKSEVGLLVRDNASPTFMQNEIIHCKLGTVVTDKSSGKIEKCELTYCEVGIGVSGAATTEFAKVTVSHSTKDNVHICEKADPRFTDCNIFNATMNEIRVNGGKSEWSKCSIVASTAKGIAVSVDKKASPVFVECGLTPAKEGHALYIEGAGGDYRKCRIGKNKGEGGNLVVIENVGSKKFPTFSECDINGGYNGITIIDGKASINFCKITSCSNDGIHMENAKDVEIYRCIIEENGGDGIFAKGTGSANVKGCSVNGHDGFFSKNYKVEEPFQLLKV